MTPTFLAAHIRYTLRATIVITYASWLAFWIGYLVPDDRECEA